MPCYLCCISSVAGIPLLCKKKGDIGNLPFPIQAALNGAFVFGKSFDVQLLDAQTDTSQIVWREYEASVTLIFITDLRPCGACHLTGLLDRVWDALVMSAGLAELQVIGNVERLKRQLRSSHRLVERLLDGWEAAGGGAQTFCDLTGLVDAMLTPVPSRVQTALEQVTECADSTYGCLLVRGRLAAASRNWQQLEPRDQTLLALHVRASCAGAEPAATDSSVFLPGKSPHVPFRLLVCRLSDVSDLCVLCGPTPSLAELEQEAVRLWAPVLEAVRQLEVLHPRFLPSSTQLDPAVLGLLLENAASGRSVASCCPQRGTSASAWLRHFYRRTVGLMLPCAIHTRETAAGDDGDDVEDDDAPLPGSETYVVMEDHSGYALVSGQYRIFVVFQRGTPPFVMRGLTLNTLKLLTSIKQVKF